MDDGNLENLRRYQSRWKLQNAKAEIRMFGEFSGTKKKEIVEDPYYSGINAFEKAYEQCRRFSLNFLQTTFPDIVPDSESATNQV